MGMALMVGKTVIMTGGSRGIGAAAALAMAREGAAIMITSRNGPESAGVAEAITATGGIAASMACDMSDFGAVSELIARTEAQLGPVDVLVNNAGVIQPIADLAQADPAEWARNIQINLVGPFHGARAVLPGMIARGGGTIINISSGAAHRPLEGWSAYCSGKAGLAMLTRAIALESLGKGIRVFGFAPGTIDTEMQVQIRASGMNVISKIARSDLAPVDHPALALIYLCTPAADDLAGQELSLRDEALRSRVGLS
jgi:NAD(P)-dependent dehydrogenase (short-subunit alcohol dehydrogenase family)